MTKIKQIVLEKLIKSYDFDDVFKFDNVEFSNICQNHATQINEAAILEIGVGQGICGVRGCNQEGEHLINLSSL